MPHTKKALVIEELRRRIESGEAPPGSKLPSGRELCAEFNVSMIVVRQAIDYFKAKEMVEGAPGSGVYVIGPERK